MKAFQSILLTLSILLSIQIHSTVQEDVIRVSDPLQPVWDHLDSLPTSIVDPIRQELQSGFARLESTVERKISSIITVVNSRIASLGNRGGGGNSLDETTFNRTLNSMLQALYITRLQSDRDEATAKIEAHVNDQIAQLETRLKEYIDQKVGGGLTSLTVPGTSSPSYGNQTTQNQPLILQLDSLVRSIQNNNETLQTINTHVTKINEKLDDGETCTTLVDKVSEMMGVGIGASGGSSSGSGSRPPSGSVSCAGLDTENMVELRSALDRLKESPAFLPRDCSDHHWQTPEAPSGVFTTYPTMNYKDPYSVFCDMGNTSVKDSGGWTVLIRRQNSSWGLQDFNRTWAEYRDGFGNPGEGEWWYSLSRLHALTYRQPYDVKILMNDVENGPFHAKYTTFRVEDEAKYFSLVVDGFDGNVSMDALASKHHGSSFTTYDKDNDNWDEGNCAVNNGGGWWFNRCHYTTLTAPFPVSADRNAKTIRWRSSDGWMVFDDVTLMIRPTGYADRFNSNTAS